VKPNLGHPVPSKDRTTVSTKPASGLQVGQDMGRGKEHKRNARCIPGL